MDIANELFGTFSGWLVVIVGLIMVVGIPGAIWWAVGHTSVSPCEQQDREAHPQQ